MIAKALITLAIAQIIVEAADQDRWVWSKNGKSDDRYERVRVPPSGLGDRGPNKFPVDDYDRYDVNEPTTRRPKITKPQQDELDDLNNDDPRYGSGGAGPGTQNDFGYGDGGGNGFYPQRPLGNPNNGVLVGPEGPTGIIGRPKGNPANGVLVGPGGPTGVIGRPYGGPYPGGARPLPGQFGGQFPGGQGPFLGGGQFPGGVGQYPGGAGLFPGGQRPGGPGQFGPVAFPSGAGQGPGGFQGQFPGGGGQFPGGGGQFPIGGAPFPGGPGQFPAGGGQFPVGGGQFPAGGGQFPGGAGGQFPGQFPPGGGQFPGGFGGFGGFDQGQGQYPDEGAFPYNNNGNYGPQYDDYNTNSVSKKASKGKSKDEKRNSAILKSI